MKKKASPVEQLSPEYGYDEHGRWNGMTREEVRERIECLRLAMFLFHWMPPSSPPN